MTWSTFRLNAQFWLYPLRICFTQIWLWRFSVTFIKYLKDWSWSQTLVNHSEQGLQQEQLYIPILWLTFKKDEHICVCKSFSLFFLIPFYFQWSIHSEKHGRFSVKGVKLKIVLTISAKDFVTAWLCQAAQVQKRILQSFADITAWKLRKLNCDQAVHTSRAKDRWVSFKSEHTVISFIKRIIWCLNLVTKDTWEHGRMV